MENKSKYSDVIKTDSFFIGKKADKEIYIQKTKDIEFNKVCQFILDSEKREERRTTRQEKFLKLRQRKKDFCIKFELNSNIVKSEILGEYEQDKFPQLKRLEFMLYSENEGVFRGNQLEFDSFIKKLRGIR